MSAEQRLRETNDMLRTSNVELKKELESERLRYVTLTKEKVASILTHPCDDDDDDVVPGIGSGDPADEGGVQSRETAGI